MYKIIKRITPEVIFEEISPDGFASIYEGTRRDTLETNTIKMYLQEHPIAHFPVDLDSTKLLDADFINDVDEMFKKMSHRQEYNYLAKQRRDLSAQLGFKYLNSDQGRELMERKSVLEEGIVQLMGNEKMTKTYKRWSDIIDRRENEMIKNIYSYSEVNEYNRALFLVGAEHRKSIINKILKFEKDDKFKLNWILDYFN